MADAAPRRWTIDEFFAWQEKQDDRYELVDGFPLRMMAGAKAAHDLIVVNVVSGLRVRLRGGGCRPFTGDSAVETRPGQIRRPDVGVDCGPWNPESLRATSPRVVIEVLSPTTRDFDTIGKLAEYKDVAALDAIVFIEPNHMEARQWLRGANGEWVESERAGTDAVIDLPTLGVTLPLTAVYEDITFPTAPRLVPEARRVAVARDPNR